MAINEHARPSLAINYHPGPSTTIWKFNFEEPNESYGRLLHCQLARSARLRYGVKRTVRAIEGVALRSLKLLRMPCAFIPWHNIMFSILNKRQSTYRNAHPPRTCNANAITRLCVLHAAHAGLANLCNV